MENMKVTFSGRMSYDNYSEFAIFAERNNIEHDEAIDRIVSEWLSMTGECEIRTDYTSKRIDTAVEQLRRVDDRLLKIEKYLKE